MKPFVSPDPDAAPLTRFLAEHGFSLQSVHHEQGQLGRTWWIYQSAACDLAFGFPNSELYGNYEYVICDAGGAVGDVPSQSVSLSYYVPDFYVHAHRALLSGSGKGDSLVRAFGDSLPAAISLFQHVRQQRRWLPLRADRAAVSPSA